jgi:hypothetical protein
LLALSYFSTAAFSLFFESCNPLFSSFAADIFRRRLHRREVSQVRSQLRTLPILHYRI